jgi:alpha-L-fucosidase
VRNLADSVAKGGGLMIGVGPSAHGEFHPEAIRQMKGAGGGSSRTAKQSYSTRAREGTRWSEGDNLRYTRSKDRRFVFALLTELPGAQAMLKKVQPRNGSRVTLLGATGELPWKFDSASGTTITLPENLQQASNRPCEYAWTLKIEPVEN